MSGRGLVVPRILNQRMLVLSAVVTALFATTVLAALAGYADSAGQAGLRRALAGATFGTAGVRIQATSGDLAQADQRVRGAVGRAFGPVPAPTSMIARSDSYTLPGEQHAQHPRLTVFGTVGDLATRARLTSGAWPSDTPHGTVQAVLPDSAARAMKTRPGATLTVHDRSTGSAVTVKVTGTFAARDAADYHWDGDPLFTTGVERLDYTTLGPLVVSPGTFAPRFGSSATAHWLVLPDLGHLRQGDLTSVSSRVKALPSALTGLSPTVSTPLPGLLGQLKDALLVSRSTMLIPALQLVVLAAYALMLVARLLAEHRRMEIALVRARGASGRQIAALSAAEGVLVALPGVLAAPFLAPLLLKLVPSKLPVSASPSGLTWGVAVAAGLACAFALTLPALRGLTSTYVATAAARGRGELRGVLQRAGADVALLVVAGLAVWQLAHYGGPVTAGGSGVLSIDPIIVAGPALALFAGGVLVLRLVPVASRTAERATSRGRGFAPAVGARQVSRRPLRYAGPTLLLVMAVAVGVLSVTTGVTWQHSQLAQADFQAGPDLRVTVPDGPPGPGQGDVYARLPGVTTGTPVLRDTGTAGDKQVSVLATDTTRADALLRIHGAAKLAAGRPTARFAPIPGRPAKLSFRVRLSKETNMPGAQFAALITDAHGTAYSLDLGSLPANGRFGTLNASLTGAGTHIAYPLTLRGFTAGYPLAGRNNPPMTLDVASVRGNDGGTVRLTGGQAWRGTYQTTSLPGPKPSFSARGVLHVKLPPPNDEGYVGSAQLNVLYGETAPLGPDNSFIAPTIPAVITADLASAARVGPGGNLTVTVAGIPQRIVVSSVVRALPTTDAGRPAVLLDLAALNDRLLISGATAPPVSEWWLGTRSPATVHAALAHSGATVTDRVELRRSLRDAPLGSSLQGALVLGFGAALAFALIGFAVNATVSARERLTEFAILRALGVSSRQVFGLVAVEQAFLVVLGLAGGTLVGVLVARLVVPHIVLTVRAAAPWPPVDLVLPWPPILALLGGILVLLMAVLAVLVPTLRRHGLGTAVRLGGER